MAKSSREIEQQARREAQSAVSAKRQERLAREKRLEGAAVAITAALVQRRELERVVGESLVAMTRTEGLRLREAVEWCDLLTYAEAQRLHAAALAEDNSFAPVGGAVDRARAT
jgi:hypothetical protein